MVDSNLISKKILENAVEENKISHAYLFQINDSLNNNELIFSFIKEIVCPNREVKNCSNCNICKRIEEGNYTEIKIINPDGMWIKKEQLLDLQSSFNKKSIESNYSIYVINDADKMNKSAANTILKFLEEPESGIVAILITNNIHSMLDTIVSRCQIINLKTEEIKTEYSEELINFVFDFIYYLEQFKIKAFENLNEIWCIKISNKEDIINSFEIMLLIYTDLLNYYLKRTFENFNSKSEFLLNILKYNTKEDLYKKINLIISIQEKIKYNVNINMLLDKFIIEFSGGDKYECD